MTIPIVNGPSKTWAVPTCSEELGGCCHNLGVHLSSEPQVHESMKGLLVEVVFVIISGLLDYISLVHEAAVSR
jgi:hypothetical protein